jgi:hypothetical protein
VKIPTIITIMGLAKQYQGLLKTKGMGMGIYRTTTT